MTTKTKMNQRVEIAAIDMAEFEGKFEQLCKQAKRLKLAAPTFNIVGEFNKKFNINNKDQFFKFFDIELCGEYPTYNGWSFVVRLDHEEGVVSSLSGNSESHYHHIGDKHCDHCNTKRDRHVTYIIQNEDGKRMHVGGSCLKYYISSKDLSALDLLFSLLRSFSDGYDLDRLEGCYGGGQTTYSINEILHWTAQIVATFGYDKESIRGDLSDCMNPFSKQGKILRDRIKHRSEINFDIEERIEAIKKWVSETTQTSDYFYNLRSVVSNSYCTWRTLQLVASAVPCYNRAMDEIKKRENQPESHHVGEIKKRYDFNVTIERMLERDGYYGTTFIYHLRDDSGNLLVWFGSKELLDKEGYVLPDGANCRIKATVKDHSEFRGIKQTIITRVMQPKK